jgi:hypothetical protein
VESAVENWRVRRVVIYYYLEDDSIHVAEPKQDNSGLPQVGVVGAGTNQTRACLCGASALHSNSVAGAWSAAQGRLATASIRSTAECCCQVAGYLSEMCWCSLGAETARGACCRVWC